MENNLYYTPELKELHYGFEFEYMSKDDNWIKVTLDTWNRPSKDNHLKYFTEHDLLRTLNHQDMACKYADLTCIRVKYLDQSDIESLGWIKHAINNNCYYLELHKNTFGTLYMEYYDEQQTKWCIESDRHGESIFIGIIKNKSELIKLMQQLNIK